MGNKLVSYLPAFMRKSKIFNEIFRGEEKALKAVEASIEEVQQQLNIDTATWGLELYEAELGIKTDLSKDLEERRSVIKSKWRGTGKADARLIQLVAEAYSNGQVQVSFDGAIVISFVGTRGVPPNIGDLEAAINEIKPAHLPFSFRFNYLTWSEFDGFNRSWQAWDDLNLTWEQLEAYKEAI